VYPHQRERLMGALASHRAAALVVTSEANVAYLTGFRSLSRLLDADTAVLAVMTPAGSALVIPTVDVPAAAEADVAVDHVVPYGALAFDDAAAPGAIGERVREWTARRASTPGAALADALTALGGADGAIALDDGGLTPAAAREITAALRGRTLVDGGAALGEARQVKGPWEIEALERALGAAEEALNAVVQALKPGTSEREAIELFEAEVRRRDATPRAALITFGPRTAWPVAPSSTRTLRTGDLVRLDVGCVWQGYHAGVARTAVMGPPAPRHEAVFEAVAAGLDAGIAAVRPGATPAAVFGAAIAAVRASGLPRYDGPHVGHGIGLDPREGPMLEAPNGTPLEAGMVVRLETPYSELGWGGVQQKETVLVTRTGGRVMNRTRRGLLVLD
jgi:Xaa-Pro aminopeptidase